MIQPFLAQLLSPPVWDEALLAQVPQEIRDLLIRYILGSDDFQAFERRVQMLHRADLKATTMTLAEQILQKGRQEGRLENLRDSIVEVLTARLAEVPDRIAETLAGIGDEVRLKALLRAASQASSLDEFSRDL